MVKCYVTGGVEIFIINMFHNKFLKHLLQVYKKSCIEHSEFKIILKMHINCALICCKLNENIIIRSRVMENYCAIKILIYLLVIRFKKCVRNFDLSHTL